MSKSKHQQKYQFSHFAGRVSYNDIQVSIYIVDENTYQLRVENARSGEMLTHPRNISINDYENLDHDPYNNLVRFQAALYYCGWWIDDDGAVNGKGF